MPNIVIFSVDCIWAYNGCVQWRSKPDIACKADFNACSMVAMGMTPSTSSTTITSTTEPELPDFLTSTSSGPVEEPIDDIDLPEYVPVVPDTGPATTTTAKPEQGTLSWFFFQKGRVAF